MESLPDHAAQLTEQVSIAFLEEHVYRPSSEPRTTAAHPRVTLGYNRPTLPWR